MTHKAILFPHENQLFPTPDFLPPLFLNENGRIWKKRLSHRLSNLHYLFQTYTSLIKPTQLESQYLPSYECYLAFFSLNLNFEEDSSNLAGIEIQAEPS